MPIYDSFLFQNSVSKRILFEDDLKECRLSESHSHWEIVPYLNCGWYKRIFPTVYSVDWNDKDCFAMTKMYIRSLKNVFWDINQVVLDCVHEAFHRNDTYPKKNGIDQFLPKMSSTCSLPLILPFFQLVFPSLVHLTRLMDLYSARNNKLYPAAYILK